MKVFVPSSVGGSFRVEMLPYEWSRVFRWWSLLAVLVIPLGVWGLFFNVVWVWGKIGVFLFGEVSGVWWGFSWWSVLGVVLFGVWIVVGLGWVEDEVRVFVPSEGLSVLIARDVRNRKGAVRRIGSWRVKKMCRREYEVEVRAEAEAERAVKESVEVQVVAAEREVQSVVEAKARG